MFPTERLAGEGHECVSESMPVWIPNVWKKKKSCMCLTSTIWGISTREHYLHMWPNLSTKERIGTIFTHKKRKLSSPWFNGLKNLKIF